MFLILSSYFFFLESGEKLETSFRLDMASLNSSSLDRKPETVAPDVEAYWLNWPSPRYPGGNHLRGASLASSPFSPFFFWPLLSLFFFFNTFIYFLFLFFGCVGSLLLRAGFLWLRRAGPTTLHCSARASHCGGFSCCGARIIGVRTSVVVARGLSSCGSRALERRLSSCGSWA